MESNIDTIISIIVVLVMLINMFFICLSFLAVWAFKIIFGRLKEFRGMSIGDDDRLEKKIDETAMQRRDVDTDIYKQLLKTNVKIAHREGVDVGCGFRK